MMCRSRYLTADGRVLRCSWGPEVCRKHHAREGGGPYNDYVWPASDPCAWEAPDCFDCGGTGVQHYNGTPPCCSCDGTGVDDTVPLALVGAGSVLAYAMTDRPGVPRHVVFIYGSSGDFLTVTQDGFGHLDIARCDVGPGKPWKVVRAVPPAHTGDTP